MKTKRCKNCQKQFNIKRNPEQQYCSDHACQNKRKQLWRKKKLKTDLDYRSNQRTSNKKWQTNHPDYWRKYRETHSVYTNRNREQQRSRRHNKCVKSSHSESSDDLKFAKSDALLLKKPIEPGTYQLQPVKVNEFAKSDALIVKIDLLSVGYVDSA